MTYSRKRFWLAKTATFIIAVVAAALMISLQPAYSGLWAMALVATCAVFAFLGHFSQDEIQLQNEMRAWYYGGLLAVIFALVPFSLLASDTALEVIAGFLPHPGLHAAKLHLPKVYFALGIMATILAQVVGFFVARIVQRLRP